MAAMVAPGSSLLSSTLAVQDKGHRNKRKFRMDPPISDQNTLIHPPIESYYHFSSDKSLCDFSVHHHADVCDFCTSPSCTQEDETDMDEYPDVDCSHWTKPTEAQLEDLVLKTLHMIFKSAISKIFSYGYDEETATKAVLRSGNCYGCKDTASNIADNALALLTNGKDIDSSLDHLFEDMQQLEKYVLAEMICVVREVRPFFSTGDAMWCLLISDMNVSHACAMDTNSLSGLGREETGSSSSLSRLKQELNSYMNSSTSALSGVSQLTTRKPNQANSSSCPSRTASQTQTLPVAGIPNLPSVRPSSSKVHAALSKFTTNKERPTTSSQSIVEEFSCTTVPQSYVLEEKLVNGKKSHGGSSKRESSLQHKLVHLEKSFHAYKSKGASRAGKHGSLGSLLLDKKCKSSEYDGINLKSATAKKNRSVGVGAFQADGNPGLPFCAGGSASLAFGSKAVYNSLSSLTTSTELSLSIPSKSANSKPNNDVADYRGYSGVMFESMGSQWVSRDKKDEMMFSLVPRVQELQAQLQEWTEWAQEKVMQAALRLNKDKSELQSLRQEKDEVSRLKKDKQTLEENTVKKLTEMESALSKASSQVEKANAASLSLEAENARLRLEMEAAKLRAAESAASCQEISKREMKTLKNSQSWELEKTALREDLMVEKCKCRDLHKQVEQAKAHLYQLEGKRRQEARVKDEILLQANYERIQGEQMKASAKSKENAIVLEAEKNLQRYKDEVQMLATKVSKLKLNTDVSEVTRLVLSLHGNYNHSIADGKTSSFKEKTHSILGMLDLQESGNGDVERERECVMCLMEEMSVVFLPCSHQVVCNTCNDLHLKQGMKDCPSCRTPIQRRIQVRHAGANFKLSESSYTIESK